MAGALVGGALLSAFLQVAFDRLASPQVVDFFRQRKLDETLLNKLKLKLLSIDALADDAEQKQLRDPRVREWLFAVKDVVFDAEDLLAEIDHELTKCQVEAESQSHTLTYKVSNLFNSTFSSFNRKIDSGMKEVLEKMEYYANQKGDLGLEKATYSGVGSGSKVSQKLESSSSVAESVIYGRNYDKDIIFNWLTSETDNHNQLSILSVVGMGGLGKTTLAQHVFNDPRVEEANFDIKAWVCVSDDFELLTVTRTILEAITKSNDDSRNLEMVHGRLKEELSGKKFLLVLDDVWIQRQKECEAVLTPLNHGAPGSKILVTTRSESVASNMRSSKVHLLRQLEGDYCWQVFAKHAFLDDHPQLDSEIKEIATKIVAKCKGLPLALTSIGSLLHTKSSVVAEWKRVLLSNIWDLKEENSEIIPALFLSYCHLPSYLKRCFAFCALFPKDYVFDKEELILLWMAEGFLQCPQQSQSPLEVGEIYFDDLLSRSFFQQSSRGEMYFNMHDLLNDLAKYVCGDICFRLGVDTAKSMPKTTRHILIATGDPTNWAGSGSLTDAKRLRTFIPTSEMTYDLLIPINELFSKFKYLRVLSLFGYSDLTELPESVSELKYLCSLDLSDTNIKRLPDSTCLLYNLQILKLNFCWSLEELPSNLHKLTNLRCLEFRETEVKEIPVLLEKLKKLQVLSSFLVGKSSESSIQQLRGLNLRGELAIEELQNIVNPTDALAVDLKNKTQLVKLALVWNSNHIPDDQRKDREVFENLQPSMHLKDLTIINYGGTQFASWLSNNSLFNVVSLRLANCKYCVCLPCLGLLPSLKKLWISAFHGIVSIGVEFYGSSSCPFPSLEELEFKDMKEWEEWECTSAFPRLQYLRIEKCPKLNGLSKQLFQVKKVDIRLCKKVTISGLSLGALSLGTIEHTVSNTCLDLLVTLNISHSCDSLTTFPLDFFPKLCYLVLESCCNIRMISQERTHTHLKQLLISKCHQFESFPNEGLSAPKLDTFTIEGLENLKSLPQRMHILLPSLAGLSIRYCRKVEMLSERGLPSNLKSVDLSSYKLMASLKGSLGVNTCLERLSMCRVDDVECFPEEGILPLSLTSLTIWDCPNLKKLDYKGLCHLSSLKELRLYNCPKLECLPEEGLPKSISTLYIWDCPLLKQRCQKPEGQDWGKIAHIQNLSEYLGEMN